GPYLGWIPLARAVDLAYPVTPEVRALPVLDAGCGYAIVVALDGPSPGELWVDARAVGVVRPLRPSFTTLYLEWIDRLAHNVLLEPVVPPGGCALATALGGYLGVHEQRLGLDPGTIGGAALHEALAQLGPGAITITAERSPIHREGSRVDPCVACATLLANLGVASTIVMAGVRALI
nr:hypothetical protein [Myxococcota bacterium]